MNTHNFHISLYDLAFLGTIFIGLTVAVQLWFIKRDNRAANRFLALALATIVLQMTRVLGTDIKFGAYYPRCDWFPLQFSLALGPLLFFYVLKITRPQYKLRWKDWLHLIPVLLQQGVLVLQIKEEGDALLQPATFVSVVIYLFLSFRLIARFYQRSAFNDLSDRYRRKLQWLQRLLKGFGLVWLLWIPYTALDYFYYHHQSGLYPYYSLYLLLAITMIWMAVNAFLQAEIPEQASAYAISKLPAPALLKQKGAWLKKAIETNMFYQDAELTLSSLAEKLEMQPKELSRIVNTGLKKNFNDFINEYRVRDAILRMQDPAFDHITLLGIAFDAGFNSKSTFNRIFKQMTGKSPVEYKAGLKKERPNHDLRRSPQFTPVILSHKTTPKWYDEKLNRNYMFRNYLKIAWRNITRNRSYAVINVTGLAVGITSCILIMLFVRSELSYDAFHSKADRLYRVWQRRKLEDKMSDFVLTSMPLANGMQSSFPQIEAACRVHSLKPIVKIGQRSFAEDVDVVDPSFFRMFDFKIAEGSRGPFSLGNSIVVTAATAKKYFGNSDAIGKNIVINFGDEKLMSDTKSSGKDEVIFTVRGIVNDVPEASSIKYGALISFADAKHIFFPAMLKSWFGINTETYVLLKPGVTASAMEKKFPAMLKQYIGADFKPQDFSLHLQPINDIHFDTSLPAGNEPISDSKYSYILGTIGLLILLVACINFVTLSIGQSTKRALEVGVRKAMGAGRGQLIVQFWGEAFMVVLLSVLIGLLFASLLIGPFDTLVSRQLSIHFDWFFVLFCVLMVVVIAIISGIYPALILSGFNPVEVLKGKLNIKGGGGWLRQGLVVGQFVTSIIMIIGTVIIGQQMHYLQTKDLGYKKDQVVIVETHKTLTNGYSLAGLYRDELMKHPHVMNASVSLFSFIQTPWAELGFNDDTKQFKLFQYNAVDANFIPAMGIKLIDGRNFETGNPHDLGGSAIVNEAFVREFNLTNPVGKKLAVGFPQTIIGVVKDFNFESLHTKIQPLVLSVSPDSLAFISGHVSFGANTLQPRISIQLKAGNLSENINVLRQAWAAVAPGRDFDYKFLDDAVAAQYKQEQRTNTIVRIASGLSIFIACMGLFGLATLAVVKRVKEIGIRKVLGASVANIVSMLSKDFLTLVILSLVIASPIAYYFMHSWLQDFAYRINISWWMFAAAGLAAIFIAVITVSFQSVKAALANPVKSLRSE